MAPSRCLMWFDAENKRSSSRFPCDVAASRRRRDKAVSWRNVKHWNLDENSTSILDTVNSSCLKKCDLTWEKASVLLWLANQKINKIPLPLQKKPRNILAY